VLTACALVAIVLAGVGIHGLLALTVSLRTQEIGVRMALGAERGQVLTMIVRQGVGLAAAGIIAAAPIAYAAARLMTSLLFGVTPGDLPVYVAAAAIGLLMALTGSLRPALRAAGVDPARTIRGE